MDEEALYIDPINPAEGAAAGSQHPPRTTSQTCKLILFRLPSLIMADLILLQADYLGAQISERFASFLNYYLVVLISKLFILLSLFICFQLFTLKTNFCLNLYKILGLISLPFVFTAATDYARCHTIPLPFSMRIPSSVLVCAVYALIVPLTISLYYQIYTNLIADKKKLHERYRFDEGQSEEVFGQYLESLFEHEVNNESQENLAQQEIAAAMSKRRLYILFYSCCSFAVNDFYSCFYHKQEFGEPEIYNIMSLGYLALLFYDLSNNFDQLFLRLLINLKYIGNLINEFGFNNLLSYNWFDRLRVPFVMRVYFAFKCLIFTLSFLTFHQYYVEMDKLIENQNTSDESALFSYIQMLVKAAAPAGRQEANTKTELSLMPTKLEVFTYLNKFFFNIEFVKSNPNTYTMSCESTSELVQLYFKMLVLNLSETFISIGAITSVLSYKFYLIGKIVSNLTLNAPEVAAEEARQNEAQLQQNANQQNENELLNVGDVAAIFFFLLSIQTGLSSLHGQLRIEKFLKNYSLLFIAILHFFHTSIDSQLMALSASSKPNWKSKKHFRLLSICGSLILLPLMIIYILWTRFCISTWYLAATAFNIELIIKMSVTIVLYSLFIIDSKRITSSLDKFKSEPVAVEETRPDELADNLDDAIYYVKGFGHVTEFCIALFLFFNGAYILFFESYGAIRAIMMCIHAYFHIYVQGKKGWSVYMKRRSAIRKLKRLALFNRANFSLIFTNEVEEEDEYQRKSHDPCAICFSELYVHEARITNCKHLFHSICLRKWLYLQDTCPMCHSIVYKSS